MFGGGTAVRETGPIVPRSAHTFSLETILTMICLQNTVFIVVLKGVPTLRRLLTPVLLLVAFPPTHTSEDGSRSPLLVHNFYI